MKPFCCLLLSSVLVATIHSGALGDTEHADIKAEITKRHDEAVKRLQDWIGQVSIAAENRGYPEGAEYMAKLARDAGFQQATVINTDGKPGVFATLDAGAPKTVGLYFMYEYYIIESANPKIQDFNGATMSFVEYLYQLAK
jgi:hypothetical protein